MPTSQMGNNRVFNEIRERLRRLIRRKRKNYVSPRFDTSDIIQESMLQLMHEVDDQDDNDNTVGQGLLDKVANGHLAKQLRYHHAAKRSVEKEELGTGAYQASSSGTDPCDATVRSELTEIAINALTELDELQRKIVTLRFFQDATYEQIAEQLNVNVYQVRAQLMAALSYLNQKLDSNHGN